MESWFVDNGNWNFEFLNRNFITCPKSELRGPANSSNDMNTSLLPNHRVCFLFWEVMVRSEHAENIWRIQISSSRVLIHTRSGIIIFNPQPVLIPPLCWIPVAWTEPFFVFSIWLDRFVFTFSIRCLPGFDLILLREELKKLRNSWRKTELPFSFLDGRKPRYSARAVGPRWEQPSVTCVVSWGIKKIRCRPPKNRRCC